MISYRNSLMHGETDQVPQTSKKAYTRKRQVAAEDEDGEDGHMQEDEGDDDIPMDMD